MRTASLSAIRDPAQVCCRPWAQRDYEAKDRLKVVDRLGSSPLDSALVRACHRRKE